ncbi:MAG: APC family permease [Gemmatimonadota bacterium]
MSQLHEARPTLRKSIGGVGFFALAFGSMIGIGWVTAMGGWLASAGPVGAMLGFALGGALMIFIGLCYAELTPMLPVAGGEVAYAYKASGTGRAFFFGWFLAFGYLSVSAFEAISIGLILSYMLPWIDLWPLYQVGGATVYASHLVLALFFTGLITGINYMGVRWAAGFQILLTGAFVAVTLIFIVAGLAGGELAHLDPAFAVPGRVGILGGIAAVFVTAPFWYVGFDTIAQGAEEAKGGFPPRRLGTLILSSIVGATLFYLVLILAVAMTGPWTEIVEGRLPTAEAFGAAFGSPFLVNLVLVAALIGLFTSWNGFFLAGTRVLFALGRGRMVPPWLGATHPHFGTPANAIVLAGVVTFLGAMLGRGAMLSFVNVGSFCIALVFFGVAHSTLRLRRTDPGRYRPYRIPGGTLVPWVALAGALFILAVMLIPGSGAALSWPLEWMILASFSLLGALFWVMGRELRAGTTKAERDRLVLGEEG